MHWTSCKSKTGKARMGSRDLKFTHLHLRRKSRDKKRQVNSPVSLASRLFNRFEMIKSNKSIFIWLFEQ
jgi:hypothetical protein